MNRYLLECRKFMRWCNDVKAQFVLPQEPVVVAAYLSQLHRKTGSPSTVSMAYAALVWLHDVVDITCSNNPLKTGVCRNVVEAAKRNGTQRKNRKLPLSIDMVKRIVAKHGKVDANLKDLRISVIVLLGFAGFFRFNELAIIKASHITFADDHMSIVIPSSKTDVYREGNKAIIARTDNATCPVSMVLRYMSAARMDHNADGLLIRQLVFQKNYNTYVLGNKGISYSRCREIFLEALKALGYNSKLFGLHSLRSGGATAAVTSPSDPVSDRLLKLHGRWKSDYAKDLYIQEDISARLSVSSSLGI
ncbi:integrase/recombinase xerD homolog [Montipora foliosa]|uniref:integrase/recombinase xerD homolog n=1 Tax=Montipora foliosa TaxID=591990 RepID=UPI0035F1FAE4